MPCMAAQVIRVRVERDGAGLLVQCIDDPSIIVTGMNRTNVQANIKACIAGYVQAFPRARRMFFAGDRMKKLVFAQADRRPDRRRR